MDIYFKAVKPALKTPYSLGHRIAEIKNGEYPKSKVCLIDLYILLWPYKAETSLVLSA